MSTRRWPRAVLLALAAVVAGVALFFAITSARIVGQAARDEARPADAIIVFGAAEYAGRPSPVFRARLDHALDLFQRGLAPMVITTGGAGYDPVYTEGGVGRDYLMRHGVPDRNLIAETQGGDTAQSAERVSVILKTNRLDTAIAVSDAYHIFRIKRLLEREGIHAYGSPRPQSVPRIWSARVQGALREALSYGLWRLNIT